MNVSFEVLQGGSAPFVRAETCGLFDFAETYDDDSGLALFKNKWGAKTVAYSGGFEKVISHPAGDVFRWLMNRRERFTQ